MGTPGSAAHPAVGRSPVCEDERIKGRAEGKTFPGLRDPPGSLSPSHSDFLRVLFSPLPQV